MKATAIATQTCAGRYARVKITRNPAGRSLAAPLRRVAARSQTVWNGEGPDYDMRDVEMLHESLKAPKQTVWNGEGPDYDMYDVERLHDSMKARAAPQMVWNGEGPDYSMDDVERFHEAQAARLRRGPDVSQYNGEGPDFSMRDVEEFAEEARKDKAVRRK